MYEPKRCPKCWRRTTSKTRRGSEHWPYCPDAPQAAQHRWAQRAELRALREAGRL